MNSGGRVFGVVFLAALAATASANAATGLALEIFDLKIWTVYVIVTIIFEAWFIGRWFGFGWPSSLLLSAGFNAITALTCAGGLFAPFLHPGAGTNPFLHTLTILSLFGLASALVEGAFWDVARKKRKGKGSSLLRSFLAHLVGIPISLLILLSPAEPYKGLEYSASTWRFGEIQRLTMDAYTRANSQTPFEQEVVQFATPEEFKEAFVDSAEDPERARRALLAPDYGRFSNGDGEPYLIELNHESPEEREWLVRFLDPGGGGISINDEWIVTRLGDKQ